MTGECVRAGGSQAAPEAPGVTFLPGCFGPAEPRAQPTLTSGSFGLGELSGNHATMAAAGEQGDPQMCAELVNIQGLLLSRKAWRICSLERQLIALLCSATCAHCAQYCLLRV